MTAAFSSALAAASDAPAPPAAETSPVSTPAQTTPTAEPSAPAATTQAASETPAPATESTPDASTEKPKGEPPKWRWQDILANQRKEAADEAAARVRQELEQQYADLKQYQGVSPQDLQVGRVMRAALAGDPQAIERIKSNPSALNALRAIVAEQQQSASQEPEPDLQLPDGTLVYSAGQLAKREAYLREQLLGEFRKEIAPLRQTHQQLEQRERLAQAHHEVTSVLAEFRADPDFAAHEADVKAELAADARLADLADRDPKQALEIAFSRVWRAKVLPSRQQQSEAHVLSTLQQRAVAGTVSPSAPVPSQPKAFRPGTQGFAEALQHFSGGTR